MAKYVGILKSRTFYDVSFCIKVPTSFLADIIFTFCYISIIMSLFNFTIIYAICIIYYLDLSIFSLWFFEISIWQNKIIYK